MDTLCIVCGEPWDYYGARHGDMEKWEFVLFRAGAGCPSCAGVPADPVYVPETLSAVEFGDEDCIERIHAIDPDDRPRWQEPADEILWTCSACDVQVVKDANGKIDYYKPPTGRCRHWYVSHSFDFNGTPTEEPSHIFGADGAHEHQKQPVCEFCHQECEMCETQVSSLIETGDVYDDGWCAIPEGYDLPWCLHCIETQCSECSHPHDGCTCELV